MQDLDAFDLLHRLNAFADDCVELLDELASRARGARFLRQQVFRLVEHAPALRFNHHAYFFGLGLDPDNLRLALGDHHIDSLATLCSFSLFCGEDLLLGLNGAGPCDLGLDLRFRSFERLLGESDGALKLGKFQGERALDGELLDFAIANDASLLQPPFGCDAGAFDIFIRGDFGFLKRLTLGNLHGLQELFTLDAQRIERTVVRQTRLLDLLARRNLVGIDRALACDLAALGRLFAGNSRFSDVPSRGDFGSLDRLLPRDLPMPCRLLVQNPRFGDHPLIVDSRLLHLLAGNNLGCLNYPATSNFEALRFLLTGNARLGQGALMGDPRLLQILPGADLCLLRLGLPHGALPRQLGPLGRATEFDLALLSKTGAFAFEIDGKRLLLGFEVALADLDLCILLDIVTKFAAGLYSLDQPGQTFGVEPV